LVIVKRALVPGSVASDVFAMLSNAVLLSLIVPVAKPLLIGTGVTVVVVVASRCRRRRRRRHGGQIRRREIHEEAWSSLR